MCFPGDGIDADESQAEAAVREMREELNAAVLPVCCVWHHRSEERALTLWGRFAELHSSILTPNPTEVEEILWLTADEATRHPDALPRTAEFITALQRMTGC